MSPLHRLASQIAESLTELLLSLFAQYTFERPLLHIFPKANDMPGEGQWVFKKEPVGICPGAVHLGAAEAVFRRGGQGAFEGSKVRLPRVRIERESFAAVMGVAHSDH